MTIRRLLAPLGFVVVAIVALMGLTAPIAAVQGTTRYSAFAVDMTANMGATTANLDIVVTHWATDAESARITNVLLEQGSEKLLDLMRELPRAGSVSTAGSIGFDIRYARRTVGTTGAEQVLLLTDRPIGMWEASARPRSIEYPFTVLDLKLSSAGRGDGTLTAAAKIGVDRVSKLIILENFSDQPIRLQAVKRETK
jgi:hypothetical protein